MAWRQNAEATTRAQTSSQALPDRTASAAGASKERTTLRCEQDSNSNDTRSERPPEVTLPSMSQLCQKALDQRKKGEEPLTQQPGDESFLAQTVLQIERNLPSSQRGHTTPVVPDLKNPEGVIESPIPQDYEIVPLLPVDTTDIRSGKREDDSIIAQIVPRNLGNVFSQKNNQFQATLNPHVRRDKGPDEYIHVNLPNEDNP